MRAVTLGATEKNNDAPAKSEQHLLELPLARPPTSSNGSVFTESAQQPGSSAPSSGTTHTTHTTYTTHDDHSRSNRRSMRTSRNSDFTSHESSPEKDKRRISLNKLGLGSSVTGIPRFSPNSFAPSSQGLPDDWVAQAMKKKPKPALDAVSESSRRFAGSLSKHTDEVGNIIYDNQRFDGTKSFNRQNSGMIEIDQRDSNESWKHEVRVLRCFDDPRVIIADITMLVSVLGTCIVSPLCFIWGGGWYDRNPLPYGAAIVILDLLFDVIYASHLLMRLRTSFLHKERRNEVVNPAAIFKYHVKDPVYWILWLGATAHVWALAFDAPLILMNNFKLIRPIKQFLWLPDSLWRLKNLSIVRLARPCVNLIFTSHWVACILSNVGGFRERAIDQGRYEEFTSKFNGEAISAWISLYLMCFVESIYMLTGALDNPLGDGMPRERQFGALLLISIGGPLGCLFVSYFISALVREQALNCALDMRHEENKAFMLRALRHLDIPMDLQTRVLGLHEFQKTCHDSHAVDALFNGKNLSPPLELALKVYLYHDSVLATSPYLIDKDTNYVLEVISALTDQVYLPDDFVTRRGQVCSCMYFVLRGELSVLAPHPDSVDRSVMNTEVVATKVSGDYFGEIALIKDSVRTAWVRANTYTLVAVLTRKDAERIWKHYPGERQELADEVMATAQKDRARMEKRQASGGITAPVQAHQGDGPVHYTVHSGATSITTTAALGTAMAMQASPASNALIEAAAGRLGSANRASNDTPLVMGQVMEHQSDHTVAEELREMRELLEEHMKESRLVAFEHQKQFREISERQTAMDKRLAGLAGGPGSFRPSMQSPPTPRPPPSKPATPRQTIDHQGRSPMAATQSEAGVAPVMRDRVESIPAESVARRRTETEGSRPQATPTTADSEVLCVDTLANAVTVAESCKETDINQITLTTLSQPADME